MDMMDDDLIPQGARRAAREPLGTFTDTRTPHPDEYWHPLGGELDSRAPSLSSDDQGEARQGGTQREATPGRPRTDTGDAFDLQGAARMIRAALRPGTV